MSRYIDAEDVEKRIDIVMGSEPKAWDKKALRELKMYVVHALPTADVVEVVRCKDCKHWNLQVGNVKGDGLGSCDFHNVNLVTGEGFCYWADRRTDG